MITVRMSRTNHIFVAILFGGLFVYLLYGAFTGDLYIPSRHGAGSHLHGFGAWMVATSPALIYLGLLIRSGLFQFPSRGIQGSVELALLALAVILFTVGVRASTDCSTTSSFATNQVKCKL